MKKLSQKKVLITGAAGFIGMNMADYLSKSNAEVHGIVRSSTNLWRLERLKQKVTIHYNDLLNYEKLKELIREIEPEYIFNFAGPNFNSDSLEDYGLYAHRSYKTLVNLLRSCSTAQRITAIVHAGSSLEYGEMDRPVREDDIIQPYTLRGIIKANETLLCQYFAKQHNLPIYIARIFRAYGPWEQPERLIIKTLRTYFANKSISLVSPSIRKDFIFVDDLIRGLLLFATKSPEPGMIINFGSGKHFNSYDIIKTIETILGDRIKINDRNYGIKNSDINYHASNIKKAKEILGWKPEVNITSGLTVMVEWYKKYSKLFDKNN